MVMKSEQKRIRPEKEAMIREIKDQVAGSLYVLLADNDGMDMVNTSDLRKRLRGADAQFHVVKNRLLRVAGAELGMKAFDGVPAGPTMMVIGSGDVVEVAKILKRFSTENKKPAFKGGVLDGALLSAEDVGALAELPPKEQLQASLVGTLAAPMMQLAGVMSQKLLSVVYVLKAAQQQREES